MDLQVSPWHPRTTASAQVWSAFSVVIAASFFRPTLFLSLFSFPDVCSMWKARGGQTRGEWQGLASWMLQMRQGLHLRGFFFSFFLLLTFEAVQRRIFGFFILGARGQGLPRAVPSAAGGKPAIRGQLSRMPPRAWLRRDCKGRGSELAQSLLYLLIVQEQGRFPWGPILQVAHRRFAVQKLQIDAGLSHKQAVPNSLAGPGPCGWQTPAS